MNELVKHQCSSIQKTGVIPIKLSKFSEKSVSSKKYIPFGEDNLYPQSITTLFNESAINRTSIQAKLDATLGKGLSTINEDLNYTLAKANSLETWQDVFEKVSLDYILYGGYCINIIWSNDGKTIAEMYHIDFSKVRSGQITPGEDAPKDYFYSNDWSNQSRNKPQIYPSYNPSKSIEDPSQFLYSFDYNPGVTYYPLPSYAGSIDDIILDIETVKFHVNNLANGLHPSLFVSFNNGVGTPESRGEVYDEISKAFSGENSGKAFVAFSQDKEHAPEVTPINLANDGYYITLETRITSRILTGHRISSPLLVGLQVPGQGFNSNADELETSYKHFLATCIKPIQKVLIKTFNNMMIMSGYPNNPLEIRQNTLFTASVATTNTTL